MYIQSYLFTSQYNCALWQWLRGLFIMSKRIHTLRESTNNGTSDGRVFLCVCESLCICVCVRESVCVCVQQMETGWTLDPLAWWHEVITWQQCWTPPSDTHSHTSLLNHHIQAYMSECLILSTKTHTRRIRPCCMSGFTAVTLLGFQCMHFIWSELWHHQVYRLNCNYLIILPMDAFMFLLHHRNYRMFLIFFEIIDTTTTANVKQTKQNHKK